MGEILEGHDLQNSDIPIVFAKDSLGSTSICSLTLDSHTTPIFHDAITRSFWFQMYLDDLPLWGMVGELSQDKKEPSAFVFTHKALSIAYHENRIIEVNLTNDKPVKVESGAKLDFTYSVNWQKTDKVFADRFKRYLDHSFFEHQIHWFSIFNSFMMVIFLCGLVSLILIRTLRNDYAKYTRDEDDDIEGGPGYGDEAGWKQVHSDVYY
jgi:transmembrane 9 superfamily protein 3